jgi:hypothetical protein
VKGKRNDEGGEERRGNNQNWEESKNGGDTVELGREVKWGEKLGEKIEILKTKRIDCVLSIRRE